MHLNADKTGNEGSNGCEKWIPAYVLLRPRKLFWCLKLLISVVWLWCFSHSKYHLFWKWWTSLSQLKPGCSYSTLRCWSGELSMVCLQANDREIWSAKLETSSSPPPHTASVPGFSLLAHFYIKLLNCRPWIKGSDISLHLNFKTTVTLQE